MAIILIIVGILGIFISLFNLYSGARYIATQMILQGRSGVMPDTVWQLNTMPALSTILLFLFHDWIFAIGILLTIIQMLSMGLASKKKDKMLLSIISPAICGFLGRIIIVFGAAIILTLSLTRQNFNNPTVWSWYLPVFIVAIFVCTLIANKIFGWMIGFIAFFLVRDST